MSLSCRPAVVANLTESATPPSADRLPPTPATPTTVTEATGRGGNPPAPFIYRGFIMVRGEERDGDGWVTPEYFAWRPSVDPADIRGETLHLSHPRFRFTPTREWFEREVDRALAVGASGGVRSALIDGLGVMACLVGYGALAFGLAVVL